MNPNWAICQWIDYCYGPQVEGATQDAQYFTRWGVWLDTTAGTVEYAIDGQTRLPAPASLFPTKLLGAIAISLSFDQNALPVFAIGFDDNRVEIRRNVASVPTTYIFDGKTPRLFFNGVLLPVNDPMTDVMCYYVRAGTIYSRYQRDNFGVEYVATNFPLTVTEIKKIDTKDYREILFVKRDDEDIPQNYALKSVVYPLPPISEDENGEANSYISGGRYLDIIVQAGTYSDDSSVFSIIPEGQYLNVIVLTSASDSGQIGSIIPDGEYRLVIINGGSSSDAGSVFSQMIDGDYVLVIINGGSYNEPAQINSQIAAGAYTPV